MSDLQKAIGTEETNEQTMSDLQEAIKTDETNEQTMSDLGERLSQDEWLVSNTLPFVCHFLDTWDIIKCGMVCKLWNQKLSYNLSLWQKIRLRNCKVKWDQLNVVMQKLNTRNLKLVQCDFSGRTNFVGFHQLHTLVIPDLTTNLLESLAENCSSLRVLHTNLICSYTDSVDLGCLWKLKCLEDLKISCNREVENETTLIERLSLKHMWLLEVDGMNIDANRWIGKAGKVESSLVTLGLGNCKIISKNSIPFSETMPLLTTICLCHCASWYPVDFFQNISALKNLNTLILINFAIEEHFEKGIKLCTNLDTLIIVPRASRFNVPMAFYNERIFKGVTQMELRRLKTFKWGFHDVYMKHIFRLFDQEGVVPIGTRENIYGYCLVTIQELQKQLKEILVNTEVIVEEYICIKEYRGF